jgi:hypothetical protein
VVDRFRQPLNAARGGLLLLVVALLIGHVVRPAAIRIDASTLALLFLATLLVLAPTLKSAKLPGAEFNFREKIEAAEELGTQVRNRSERELTELELTADPSELTAGPRLRWPGLFHIHDDLRQLATEQPALALAALRREMAIGLRSTVQTLSKGRAHPRSLEELVDYVAQSGKLWPEQAVLLKVLLEISEIALMSGDVEPADALRVIAVADVLNQTISLGYSLSFEPNENWEEQGLICQYEHCIENMPLPPTPRSEQESWRAHISEGLRTGAYDDRPEVKANFERVLAEPIPSDAPEEVDETGACPVFGHYCPGGVATISHCEAAREWIEVSAERAQQNVSSPQQAIVQDSKPQSSVIDGSDHSVDTNADEHQS